MKPFSSCEIELSFSIYYFIPLGHLSLDLPGGKGSGENKGNKSGGGRCEVGGRGRDGGDRGMEGEKDRQIKKRRRIDR